MDASDITQDPTAPLNYTALATQTEGYSATDLKDLVARAVHRAAIRSFELQLGRNEESQRVRLSFPYPCDRTAGQANIERPRTDNAHAGGLLYGSGRLRAALAARR